MADLSQTLLAWYDRHAREMPWRVGPADRARGRVPDPYRIWLSEVMLQQTTVAAVRPYFERFTTLWPTVADLAAAEDAVVMAEWAGLGYYARARNLLKCARMITQEHGGIFPGSEQELLKLPGIGPYTSAAIAAIAFERPAVVVDGNVERVMARLRGVETPLPKSKPLLRTEAAYLTPDMRPGDYAQAVMDLGATICTPRNPACGSCPWMAHCVARQNGIVQDLPRKLPKKPKPTRYGIVYLAQRIDGAWLVETRPPKGLLGGMLAFPSTDWTEKNIENDNNDSNNNPPLENVDWRIPESEVVRHTFTHFHLRLSLRVVADLPLDTSPTRGSFMTSDSFDPAALPTVMRKAYTLATKNKK